MNKYMALLFWGAIAATPCRAESPTAFITKTWDHVKESVSSALERSESSFFSREVDVPQKSRITIKNMTGSVAIATSSNSSKLFIEAEKRGKKSLLQSTHISVNTKETVTTIETKVDDPANLVPVYYTIAVPDSAIVTVEQQNGDIWVRNSKNALSLQTTESGSIHIEHTVNSVTARALRGSIDLIQDQMPAHASLFLEAYRKINLKLPKGTNASLHAQVGDGLITCLLPVTLEPITTLVTKEAWRALRKKIRGTLGKNSGATIVLDATKGPITIDSLEQQER